MNREIDGIAPREVLYVEDHPTNVQLMRALFKRRPHLELVIATNGDDARRAADRLQPSLLLLDLRLPDCHGAELLQQLRQFNGWEAIPAVAVTAEPAFATEGTSFSEIWRKPLDLGFVLSRLDHWPLSPRGLARPSQPVDQRSPRPGNVLCRMRKRAAHRALRDSAFTRKEHIPMPQITRTLIAALGLLAALTACDPRPPVPKVSPGTTTSPMTPASGASQ